MSWNLLERFFQSELFNNDPSLAVAYLARYPNHVGIQYVLCNKLRAFAYEEIEFFLPQICHLLVSVDSESMALEEFLIDLCQESVSGALLTFWLFQTHLHDLSSTPQSVHFKACRRIFNKVQHIVFGASGSPYVEKINDNVLPASVLASLVLTGVAAPFVPSALGPLAIAQARKPRLTDETISETPPVQTKATRPSRGHTISGTAPKHQATPPAFPRLGPQTSALVLDDSHLKTSKAPSRKHSRRSREPRPVSLALDFDGSVNGDPMHRSSTSSLPDFPRRRSPQPPADSSSLTGAPPKSSKDDLRKQSTITRATGLDLLSRREKIHVLRSNYFRNETQFLSALEGISIRLVIVPKAARLSALRAELALVARDLPADVDIPSICPATLDDGSPSRSKHHRIVRINPAEATSLNSAERVPYLLMIEVLRDDFNFDPESEANQRLLATLLLEKDSNKRRLFDITPAIRASLEVDPQQHAPESVFEPMTGDLSSPTLLKSLSDELPSIQNTVENESHRFREQAARSSSGTHTMSSLSISTPRSSDTHNSRSNSPGPKNLSLMTSTRQPQSQDPQDVSALATHMRTAAQMLTQLEMSGSKRPRQEVEAIKGKIIASMQTMEEQNFYSSDDPLSAQPPNLDSILANVKKDGLAGSPDTLEELYDSDERMPEPGSRGAGAARMENDQKLAGVRRKGDRDDPSAATFGEEWNSKRERIRRSSPYGAMKNWDLLSVIVKTGSDLRQEMFACQLIRICAKIWEDANVPVWVRQIKILVTGESSGLIETITNGVSLHSLKRSLTLSSIAAGTNSRKHIATLKDHFVKTFGEVETPGYRAASDAFTRSLAAYSILCYVLQLKDRHNGNMLIDNTGHIIHIDFGFMLSNSPGSVGFEAAPFKLTQEYVDVLGGPTGADFENFKALCKEAFQALRKSAENIVSVVEMMGKESKMACFASGGAGYVTNSLRHRFCLHLSKQEAEGFVEELISKSLGSYYTRLYDNYQYRMQGIY